jgi:hypothetical protein
MNSEDLAFHILNYLCNNKLETRSGTIEHIREELVRIMSDIYTKLEHPNPIIDTQKLNPEIERMILPVLEKLKQEGLIRFLKERVMVSDDRGSRTVINILYCPLPKGRASIKDIELNGRLTIRDSMSIDASLRFLSWYGNIDLQKIKESVEAQDIPFNVQNVERLLVGFGFCEQIYYDYEKQLYLLRCTDKGRDLKRCGSVDKFNVFDENNNRKILRRDQRTDSLWWINFWIACGAIVAALYYIWQVLKEYLPDYDISYPRLFLFCAGIIVGILVTLIIQELVKRESK